MSLVQESMSRDVVTVPGDAMVDVAIDLMIRHSISGLPVVDADGRLAGVISEYDVLQLYGQTQEEYEPFQPCERYMTRQVKTIQYNAPLAAAATIFQTESLRRLMVLDGDKFVGVLSRRDIVRRIRDDRIVLRAQGG